MLKGNRVEGEVFAFDALRCNNSHALARFSGRQFCDKGRIKTDNGIPVKVPAGELSVRQLEQEIQGWAPHSFPFRTFRSFPFKKENVTFFSVLFSSFW